MLAYVASHGVLTLSAWGRIVLEISVLILVLILF